MKSVFTLTIIFLSTQTFAGSDSCAKISKISGSRCEELKVEFDFSACKETQVGTTEIKCHGDTAKVSASTNQSIYSADLTSVESWGAKTYSLAGSVKKSASLHEKAPKKEAVKPKEVSKPKREVIRTAEAPSPAADTKPVVAASDTPLTINGTFDGYYSFNFNRPGTSSQNIFMNPDFTNNYRYYDSYHNSFALNLAEIEFKKVSGEVSFITDLDFGQQTDANHPGSGKMTLTDPVTGTPTTYSGVAKTDEVSKHIGQANFSWTPAWANGASVTVGKMYTHMGYEVPKAKDNWQYSRSFIYGYSVPVWHLGVAVSSPLYSDKLSGSLYVYNGWNNLSDNNSGKTLGAQLKITPNSDLTVIYNVIGGPEQNNNNSDWKIVNEANATYTFNPNLSFALEIVSGYESSVVAGNTEAAKWFGTSVHAKFQACSVYSLSPRFEYYRDHNGYTLATSTPENFYGLTLTNGITVGHGLEFRAEGRMDYSQNSEVFKTGSGDFSRFQFTGTLGALFSF